MSFAAAATVEGRALAQHCFLPNVVTDEIMTELRKPSSLPAEIQLMVIEELYGDTITLRNCSLVAKFWQSVSRSLLFFDLTVFLTEPTRILDLLKMLQDSRKAGRDVGCHVRKLSLIGGGPPTYKLSTGNSLHLPFLSDTLNLLLDYLPRLNKLSIERLTLYPLPLQYVPQERSSRQSRPPLKSLTFRNFGTSDTDVVHLLELLCLFSSIGSLAFHHCGPWELDVDGDSDVRLDRLISQAAGGFHTVIVDESRVCAPPIYRLIQRQGSLETITHFEHSSLYWHAATAFIEFLPMIANHLIELRMDLALAAHSYPKHDSFSLQLPLLPALVTLRLNISCSAKPAPEESRHVRKVLHVYKRLLVDPSRLPAVRTVMIALTGASVAVPILEYAERRSPLVWCTFCHALSKLPMRPLIKWVLLDVADKSGKRAVTQYERDDLHGFFKRCGGPLWQSTGNARLLTEAEYTTVTA